MSNNSYPPGYTIPEHRTVGVLSGWNKVTTNRQDETPLKGDHDFTIPDLMRLIRALREEFDVRRLTEIEDLIRRHVARTDNPHLLDLEKLNTSVFQELYKLWLAQGNQGTRDEFMKVLFQYVKIADIETTREGTAHDEVVHALGLWTVMNDHDQDPDAHDVLLETLFPGDAIKANPTFSLQGMLGLPASAEVIRNSPMSIITATGMVKEIPADSLEPDYSSGQPCFPLFGPLTNQVEESENFSRTNMWRPHYCTVERTAGIQSPRSYADDCWVIREIANKTPVMHELIYTRESNFITQGRWYTISIFVSPMGRDSFGIEIMDIIDDEGRFGFLKSELLPFDQGTFMGAGTGQWRNIHYNLTEEKVFLSTKSKELYGYIYNLHNGWYRLQFTFKALRSLPLQFRIYPLDIYDGDGNYEGETGKGCAVFGAMCTEGPFLPPYIPSLNGIKGSIAGTSVTIPIVNDWFRYERGTIVTELNNLAIDTKLESISEIYNIGNGANSIVALARMPVGHNNRVYMAGYGTKNATAATYWTKPSKHQWIQIMQGFSYSKHLFGGPENDASYVDSNITVNKDAQYLYFGCDRYKLRPLNGFIKSLTFYPELLTPGTIKFFTGRR